jgi:uncharacterized protein (TIGR00255 family)
MLSSMTGFGSGTRGAEKATVTVEVRTVNHRSLDIHIRVPREFGAVEIPLQQVVRDRLRRGRVDVSVTVEAADRPKFGVSLETAREYLGAAKLLQESLGLADNVSLRTLLSLPGVVEARNGESGALSADRSLVQMLTEAAVEAVDSVVRMRRQEGEALAREMALHLDGLAQSVAQVRELVPGTVEAYRQRLEDRLKQLLGGAVVDPQRIAQEVAVMAEKSDISEELARLESHLAQYRSLLSEGKDVGKRLDFLLQEMQRETNTILSKSPHLEITRFGLAMRADVEKLREQVQNLE